MKFWEFLLQKDGDYQWKTISTPTLELEPGKYRIMANSDLIESDVEIRLTHQPLTEDSSSVASQTSSRRTNKQGLVMICPFNVFSTGTWEIRCCGDIMSELLGETWRKTLKIQVLDQVSHQTNPDADHSHAQKVIKNQLVVENNHHLSSSNHSQNSNPINPSTDEKAQGYLEKLEQLVQQKIEPLLNQNGIDFQQSAESFVKLSSPEEIVAPTLQLKLKRDSFYRNSGESISISGSIEVEDTNEDLVLTAKLCYQLKHPQTHEILLAVECPILDETLPYTFDHTLVIPTELEGISLLLGEVILETITGIVITQYPFKVYSDEHQPVSYSIELFHTEHQASYKFDFEVTEKTEAVTNSLELPTPPKLRYPLPASVSTSRQILPPKLTQKSTPPATKTLNLPKF